MAFEYKPFEEIADAVQGLHTPGRVVALAVLTIISFGLIVNSSWRATPDSALYLELGESLAHSRSYTFNGEPHTYVPPGFPSLVAASVRIFGEGFLTYRILMAVMGLLAAVAGYFFVRRLCGPDVGLLVGGLFALNHALLHNSTFTTADVPFALFTLLGLNAVLSAAKNPHNLSWTIAAGILIGIPALIRVNGWGVPPAAAIFLWYAWKDTTRSSKLVMVAVFLVFAFLAPVGWVLYKSSFPGSFNEGSYLNAVSGRTAWMQLSIILTSAWNYVAEINYALIGVVVKTNFLEIIVPAITLVGMVAAFLKRERFLVVLTAIQFAGLLLTPAGSRYVLALIPALYLFLALGLLRFNNWISSKLNNSGRVGLQPKFVLVVCFAVMAVLNLGHNALTMVQARNPVEAGGAETSRDLPFFTAGRWLRSHAANEVVLTMHPRVIHYLSGLPTAELVRSGVPEDQVWVDAQDQIQTLITTRQPTFFFSDAKDTKLYQQVAATIEHMGLKLEEIPEARSSERFRLWRIVKDSRRPVF
ncbi:MAG: glycosyltransferase family 39 protein [Desulfomonile tiedjei]|nr:glycosyltransferase family 39 protein [Desulfomonile tiedjei]